MLTEEGNIKERYLLLIYIKIKCIKYKYKYMK